MGAPDIVVSYSGVQGSTEQEDRQFGGTVMKSKDQEFYDRIMEIPGRGDHRKIDKGWFGSIYLRRGVNAAYEYLTRGGDYVPGESKLIVYGYSAGGHNALILTRDLDSFNKAVENDARIRPGKITVDLLVTVDAAAREMQGAVDRRVGDCVLANENFYQRTVFGWKPNWREKTIDQRSEGGPNTGKCNPNNVQYYLKTHAGMQDETMERALKAIRDCLK